MLPLLGSLERCLVVSVGLLSFPVEIVHYSGSLVVLVGFQGWLVAADCQLVGLF